MSGARLERALDVLERAGNRLPDPALLFVWMLVATWIASWLLAGVAFDATDPRTGAPLVVDDLLDGPSLAAFLADMVKTFVGFAPLGVVLVAMLGIGVAEHVGFLDAGLRALLAVTARRWLTPMLIFVAILSHVAVDAGYVLVIPLGAVIFHAAGRHPLAGIAAAFSGVSGGFSASFVPVALDPLLAGLTQEAARIVDPGAAVNPLNNWAFTAGSSLGILALGWVLTDRVIEPRLRRGTPLDGDMTDLPTLDAPSPGERRALLRALLAMAAALVLLAATAWPAASAWRNAAGALTASDAPLVRAIVPLIFLLFLLPSAVYGVAAGTVRSHRDVVAGMTKAMSGMGYYLVLAFFASQFIAAFTSSNLGALVAVGGAGALARLGLPDPAMVVGLIAITALVNLFIGSASAKWALLAPIFVPMGMQLGISPDATQAAYRIGDSSTNIVTPLMPYFPLVVVYCRRWVRGAGIGTVIALMLPYSIVFALGWTALLLLYWALGIPLGVGASYQIAPPGG